jgi:major membrane immunogen (membrane-anchored lipoprotein)
MKKIILYLIMATSILGAQLVDGYYVAQEAEYYWDGYASITSIRVKNGEIVEVVADLVDRKGNLVSEDKKYNEQMLAETGTNMKMFSVEAPQNFMDSLKERDGAGGASMENVDFQLPYIDTIAGATSASKKFRKMMKFLVKKAESGKTGKHKIKL